MHLIRTTKECATTVEISPSSASTLTDTHLGQIMALIKVMIDYNCYHWHLDDCLGGKVPDFAVKQCLVLSCVTFFHCVLTIHCIFFLLAFICHHNSFLIYGSLEQPTLARWSQITHISVGSALVISAVFAVSGYTTFTGYTQGKERRVSEFFCFPICPHPYSACRLLAGDIFENYCKNDNLATFGRFCFGLSIITTFPLECFVTREVSDAYSHTSLRV